MIAKTFCEMSILRKAWLAILPSEVRLATTADLEEVLRLYHEYNKDEPLAQVQRVSWLVNSWSRGGIAALPRVKQGWTSSPGTESQLISQQLI